jgi:hypothetical protein
MADLSAVDRISTKAREPLASAYFWVLAFFLLYCARPGDWLPGLNHLHLAKIVGAFAFIAFLMAVGGLKEGLPKVTTLLILLTGQMGLASLFSPVWKGGAFQVTIGFAKVILIILVMAVAVTSVARLRRLIFVHAASVALVAAISIKASHVVGGRLEGVLNGLYSNPNDLAIAMDLTLPFCLVFFLNARGPFRKTFWSVSSLLMVYAVLRTGSRAGLLALIIAGGICLWDFGVKGRRTNLILAAFVAFVIAFAVGGSVVMERLSNTTENRGDTAAYSSAQERRQVLIKSLKVTIENPLFGIGPGDFPVISGDWVETHDVYTQLSAEAGIPALILFLIIYRYALNGLREVRQRAKQLPEAAMLASASRAGLIAFALAALFYPDAYEFFLYFVLSYATVLHEITVKRGLAGVEAKAGIQAEVVPQAAQGAHSIPHPALRAVPVNLERRVKGATLAPRALPVNLRPL